MTSSANSNNSEFTFYTLQDNFEKSKILPECICAGVCKISVGGEFKGSGVLVKIRENPEKPYIKGLMTSLDVIHDLPQNCPILVEITGNVNEHYFIMKRCGKDLEYVKPIFFAKIEENFAEDQFMDIFRKSNDSSPTPNWFLHGHFSERGFQPKIRLCGKLDLPLDVEQNCENYNKFQNTFSGGPIFSPTRKVIGIHLRSIKSGANIGEEIGKFISIINASYDSLPKLVQKRGINC